MVLAAIPSPSRGVLHLGPLPLRAYAFMIIIGVIVAVWLTGRRLQARGVDPNFASDAGVGAVLLGIIGARIYHVLTSPQAYFGKNGDLVHVLYVWNGGLGIWGAVAGGALGVWLACRRAGVPFLLFSDAAAPGLIFAQAIGRWGNYFNQELFGRPTTLPWGLKIDPAHRPIGYEQYATFHPTFLYESIWDVAVGVTLLVIDRRARLGRGRLLALYILMYTVGRGLIEALRIDDAEHFLGLRLNDWTSIVVFLGAVVMYLLIRKPVDRDVSSADEIAVGTESAEIAAAPEAGGAGDAQDGATVTAGAVSGRPAADTPAAVAPSPATDGGDNTAVPGRADG
ncbi:prolipoprotein diacylglyceryl transferase [Frankia sp. AgB1.9]|uniref:prolipoprotein diacylglyceryl transferase n=1 Tax=unclassified Frankia TaxID=2632575 RepID=UPI00193288DD|nr:MULTISPECIES: prolipoprotein diacylglyceryl transferase [unclassified Frankia]MBL7489831.1 prolipoprotein diacylglyceryl transferase [Frankia sp. AgW1.1]MBL7548197.1 prolipoprotein diacylglyceryl transferase [Frankia sp. AgB1.9]MBL7623802.1 prolipoprotein diacylglyceryl transferase [Frankia sp. AgB1.8]